MLHREQACHKCYRTEYTVRKPCYQTCYRDVWLQTQYRTESHTCYRDVCYTVCKPALHQVCPTGMEDREEDDPRHLAAGSVSGWGATVAADSCAAELLLSLPAAGFAAACGARRSRSSRHAAPVTKRKCLQGAVHRVHSRAVHRA
ncbi:MAG: hypothetical protein R3B90_06615 [Planctomycetaceae bacterium]